MPCKNVKTAKSVALIDPKTGIVIGPFKAIGRTFTAGPPERYLFKKKARQDNNYSSSLSLEPRYSLKSADCFDGTIGIIDISEGDVPTKKRLPSAWTRISLCRASICTGDEL